jgi:hypothetical protein
MLHSCLRGLRADSQLSLSYIALSWGLGEGKRKNRETDKKYA